jgi:hypothetical protein
VAIVEAVRTFGRELADIAVFSLGTTSETTFRSSRLDHGGLAAWSRGVTEVILRGQALGARNAGNLLLGSKNFLRVDPDVPAKALRLDGIEPDQLRGRAEYISRRVCPDFERIFGAHQAEQFDPASDEGADGD